MDLTVNFKELDTLGNLIVDAPNGDTRFMNASNNNINNGGNSNFIVNVQNNLTITAGSAFRKTFANGIVYVGGNIVNNGSFNLPKTGTPLYLGNFINGVAVPTTLPQTISGTGSYLTNQWSLSSGLDNVALNNLTVNNTNPAGVTLTIPNFRVGSSVIMTNGILHTSAAYPLYVGNPDVMSASNPSGSIGGGSATSYIEGPVSYANMSSSNINQLRLFPVGKNGKYLPIFISSTGGVELMTEAFDTNSGSVNTTNISNLSTNRWKVTRVGSAGTFTGYNVRLASSNSPVTASSIIVHATADQGTYDIVSTPASAITFDAAHFSIPAFPSIVFTTPQTGGFLGNFSYAQGPACSGTPTPGATIASSTSPCFGQPITLSLTTPTTGASVTYQWQSSTNGGSNWTDVSGATAATYVANPSVNTSYQCNVTCASSSTGTSTPVAITVSTSAATVTDASICTSGIANLSATGSAILNWYDAQTGGNLVATGTAYSPNVATTTTYYVASASESTGSVNTLAYAGTGASTTLYKGIAFDITNKVKLKTVTVYPKNTAALTAITISLFDATGNIVAGTTPVSFVPTLVTGTVGTVSQDVILNYNIPAGNGYRLVATSGLATTTNTLGNSTAAITYPTTGPIRLIGNVSALNDAVVTTANLTNCFHNLTFDEICESVRVPVTATVVNVPTPTGASTQVISVGVAADATIEDIVVSGTGIIWYPTALDATNNTNPIAAGTLLTDNTTYYAVSTSGICTSSSLAVLVTVVLGNESFDIPQLKFYPNPVENQLTISAKTEISKVEVYNLIGQLVKVINTNSNAIQIDLSDLNTSTYLVKVYSEQNVQNIKVIKK